MAGIIVAPANQRVPAHYINRQFGILFNLPKLGKLADPTKSFPSLPRENALALATLALTRLAVAMKGREQAAAASQAGWDAEIVLAKADVAKAEAAVAAAFPIFVTSDEIIARLKTSAANPIPAPAALAENWATD